MLNNWAFRVSFIVAGSENIINVNWKLFDAIKMHVIMLKNQTMIERIKFSKLLPIAHKEYALFLILLM